MAPPTVILRPYGIMLAGRLQLGVEVALDNGTIQEVRPHTGIPDPYVLSPAFVNAHSHLEYRGLQGKIDEPEYWGWIRQITRLKKLQTEEEIAQDCRVAARENVASGVDVILEHSDRPFAAQAMKAAGLNGAIFQEVITLLEHESPEEKVAQVGAKAKTSAAAFGGPVFLNPHAYQTVDGATLKWLGEQETPLSIHVAETPFENELTRDGSGPFADFYREHGVPVTSTGRSVLGSLDDLGLVRANTQLVHCCALEAGDLETIAARGASVAHCPRSNVRLRCPPAPVRELLEAGVRVGLGLDSAASSGPIDMFAEMRAALEVSLSRRQALEPETVWNMATEMGYDSSSQALEAQQSWRIEPGSKVPFIKIHCDGAQCTEDLIASATVEQVERVR